MLPFLLGISGIVFVDGSVSLGYVAMLFVNGGMMAIDGRVAENPSIMTGGESGM